MRIFYASDATPNAELQSNLWYSNLHNPLVDLGHDVVEFQYDWEKIFKNLDPAVPDQLKYICELRPRTSSELVKQINNAHSQQPIDLFFSYFYDACVTPDVIDEIRSLGIVTVNWYCNGSYQLHLVSKIAPHYDWCLVPEKFRISDYVKLGAHPIYCQEAANPSVYKPYDLAQEYDVTFVGQAYGDRPQIVKYLRNSGIDIHVWGPKWKLYGPPSLPRWLVRNARNLVNPASPKIPVLSLASLGGPLSDTEMVQMYSRSKINIGFSSCGDTHQSAERILQVRLRDFEVPMSGGFYMVEYMQELEEFFEIGKEIVCYSDRQDLAEKIKYYLSHNAERESIRQAGYQRALRDHTWHKRFVESFKAMGLHGK
jgi:spore maturation protein CgeB